VYHLKFQFFKRLEAKKSRDSTEEEKMMHIASPINSEKGALWSQDNCNIKNNSFLSHRSLDMLNKRRERHDGQEEEVSLCLQNARHACDTIQVPVT
jgi:hypothetical protein